MALVTLEEAKEYLRVDSADEEVTINSLLSAALLLSRDVGRVSDDTWTDVIADPTEEDEDEIIRLREILKVSTLYALSYLFEHREEADHHDLMITMRNLLFAVREGVI